VALERLTAILTPRERRVVALRFVHDLTQAEIGEQIGVSQMQVSRILRQAIVRLRAYAAQRAAAANGHELAAPGAGETFSEGRVVGW
jgi:RNA polymerase sigma-B factor